MNDNFCVILNVAIEDVAYLLCSALEGGSNYWYMIEEKIAPSRWVREERPCYSTKELAEKNIDKHYLFWYPFNPGGALVISDRSGEGDETARYLLDEAAIQNGLNIMARYHTRHFTDFLTENYDAITADVFLQCCIFKDVIYG